MRYIPLVLRLFIMFIFLQSLFFKFTGSFETAHIFGILADWSGLSWFGDIGAYIIGTAELIASALLLTRWRGIGALLAFAIMSGAVFFHLFTPLGIIMPAFNETGTVIGDDGGLLFAMACLVWASAAYLILHDLRNPQGILYSLRQRFV